jgi:uncharacterized DUF497 family protein
MQLNLNGLEFEWDKGNLHKSYQKHGITPEESEQIFLDKKLIVLLDVPHSQFEDRFIAIGKTQADRSLFVVFTIRRGKIRIVSSRKMHGKEVLKYEEIKKNPTL